jgi:DNA adenine methylase
MIIKYPGSKSSIASWIVNRFPDNYQEMTYLEPYFGGGSVFFRKEPSMVETINDLDGDVTNLFKQVRDNCEELVYKLRYTPWSREEFNLAHEAADDDLERARRFFVKCWFSIGASLIYKNGMRININSDNGNIEGFYKKLPEEIIAACERLKPKSGNYVQIENTDALTLIKKYDRPNVFMYLDPPYVPGSRKRKKIYRHEYDEARHTELLRLISGSKAKILISGYEHALYDDYLNKWNADKIISFDTANQKRVERVWMNYKPEQYYLFDIYEHMREEKVSGLSI